MGARTATLCHSHGNVGSKPCLRPTPQLTVTLDPPTHWVRQDWTHILMDTSWINFWCATKGTPSLSFLRSAWTEISPYNTDFLSSTLEASGTLNPFLSKSPQTGEAAKWLLTFQASKFWHIKQRVNRSIYAEFILLEWRTEVEKSVRASIYYLSVSWWKKKYD